MKSTEPPAASGTSVADVGKSTVLAKVNWNGDIYDLTPEDELAVRSEDRRTR
ncbi:MAG: hypothetical protein NVSMB4_09200 [Acidimicrobiales bacterium]